MAAMGWLDRPCGAPLNEQPLAIETKALRVDYGDLTAVNNVDLEVAQGEIYGLIGPNGAGKSSTIRVLATLQEPTYGDVYVTGMDIVERRREVQAVLGYMPDWAPVYSDLKVREFLELFASGYRVSDAARRVDEVLSLASLSDRADVLAGTLSRGLKQRLVLAKTLLHRPKVMLLDEPASGLDPMARIELRNMLRGLTSNGTTILISSHILTEMSGFCTSIGIMSRGVLKVSGRIENVIAGLGTTRRFTVRLLSESARALEILQSHGEVDDLEKHGGELDFAFAGSDEDAAALLAELVAANAPIFSFAERRMDVEDVFLEVGEPMAPAESEGER